MNSPKILVVEDSPTQSREIAMLLSGQSYETRVVHDGAKAIEEALCFAPDVALVDRRLPNMDGYQICHALKSHPVTEDIELIVLSQMGATEDKVMGLASGADDYVTKPFQNEELLARVRAALRRRYARDELHARSQRYESAAQTLNELIRLAGADLRNGLAQMQSVLRPMLDGEMGSLTASQAAVCSGMHRSAASLQRLVDDLLQSRLVEVSESTLQASSVAPADVLHDTSWVPRELLEERGVSLHIECAKDLPPVLADRLALAQVLEAALREMALSASAGSTVLVRARPLGGQIEFEMVCRDPSALGDGAPSLGPDVPAAAWRQVDFRLARHLVELQGGSFFMSQEVRTWRARFLLQPAPHTSAV